MINFPVKVGASTDVANYSSTLTEGQKQLLVCPDSKELFVTNGEGSFVKLVTSVGGEGEGGLNLEEIEELLNDYVLTSSLTSTLEGYVKTETVESFVTDEELTQALTSYVSTSALDAAIESSLTAKLATATVAEAGKITGVTSSGTEIQAAIEKAHNHTNSDLLNKLSTDEDGKILYDSKPLLESVDTSVINLKMTTLETF